MITFEYHSGYVLLGLLLAAGLALLLYSKKEIWSKFSNIGLGTLRFLLVAVLLILLLGPFFTQLITQNEDPIVVLAIDNSKSILEVKDTAWAGQFQSNLAAYKNKIEEKGNKVHIRTLSKKSTSLDEAIEFDQPSTNLHQLVEQVESDYEGTNLASIILFSDGIYNEGFSPLYAKFSTPIYTFGLGDTIPRQDVSINGIIHNSYVYKGNKFPIVIEWGSYGFVGERISITVWMDNKKIEERKLPINNQTQIRQEEFILEASQDGYTDIKVEIKPLNGEFNQKNNVKHAYIEVIEGKERIAIISPYPHPDIKAIRSALESSEAYEIDVIIGDHIGQPHEELAYDLVIWHHQFTINSGQRIQKLYQQIKQKNIPSWYFLGMPNDRFNLFNQENELARVITRVRNPDPDKVHAQWNQEFTSFNFEANLQQKINEMNIPLEVPYANIQLTTNAQVLLWQKLGKIVTPKPLLAIAALETTKKAVFFGTGIWSWRADEFSKYQSTTAFDQLIRKTAQYLLARDNKKRFNVYPVNSEFNTMEKVVFATEVYNSLYENIYGHKVNLSVTNGQENWNYSYVNTMNKNGFVISALKPGIYSYTAETELDGKPYSSKGKFVVNELDKESLYLTANHQLLKELATQNGGKFIDQNSPIEQFAAQVNLTHKKRITSEKKTWYIINWPYLFIILLVLISTEWFFRKFLGSY